MKKILSIAVKVLLFAAINNNLQAAPFDTGMITIKQPNGVDFIGRMWGDEFIWWAETEDGYRFIESGDGWYYYAALDQSGEYTPSNYKVGIDTPPASSYQLERTQARLDEIKEQIEQFNEQIELNRQWFAQKQAQASGQPVTLKIGIILIEFTDTTHYKTDSLGNRPDGYFSSDFDSMMFSYSGLGKISQLNNSNNQLTFDQNSQGKIKLFGKVNNPSNTQMPQKFELFQNYPNPFNPNTTIKFALPKESQVDLSVFNILGEKIKELKNEFMKPGYYEVNFDASLLSSGIYFYRIQADDPSTSSGQGFVQTKKMILVK